MVRGFDEQPARVAVAGLGDAALAPLFVARIFRRHQAQAGQELPGMVPSARRRPIRSSAPSRQPGQSRASP